MGNSRSSMLSVFGFVYNLKERIGVLGKTNLGVSVPSLCREFVLLDHIQLLVSSYSSVSLG